MLLAGTSIGLVVLYRRSQQSKWKTEELSEQQNLLLTSIGEGVYGIDSEGRCIFINPAALSILNFNEDEVIGQDQHLLFHSRKEDGSPYPHEECPISLTLQDGQRREKEDAFLRSDGQFFPCA